MTKLFFKETGEPDWEKMLTCIEETQMEPIAKISFICKVETARALHHFRKYGYPESLH